jgi:uncharacterized phage protein gp47/JayE
VSFTVPTLRALLTRVQTDLGTAADGTTPRATPEYGIARALAGLSKSMYGFLLWTVQQCFPNTAEEAYGWRWASIFGVTQKGASAWRGSFQFTGTESAVVPSGTTLQRSDGQQYTTDALYAVTANAPVGITALAAGADADNPDGQILSLTSPIVGVDTDGAVVSSTQAGADVETWADGLPRLQARLRNPPQGGGPGDYVAWALEVPGVTRAWEFARLEGDNSVSVAFARDNDAGGPIPDSGERATVLTHLQSKAPITVDVRVITLSPLLVDITLSALSPNTANVAVAIATSVDELLRREGQPGSTISLSRLEDAISSAVGEVSHATASPSTDIAIATNQLPVLRNIIQP